MGMRKGGSLGLVVAGLLSITSPSLAEPRALQHTLAEYQIPVYRIVPQRSLSEQLAS